MGFRPGQVQGLLQRKYHQVAPTGMSTSQLVADLLQEEDRGRVVGARGMFLSLGTAYLSFLISSGHRCPCCPHGAGHTASITTAQGAGRAESWWKVDSGTLVRCGRGSWG